MQRLTTLYEQWSGKAPVSVEKLAGAGSNRAYYRMTDADGRSVIGCIGTSREENHAFVSLARHFYGKGLPVPQVFAVSSDEMCYLQQDLGSKSLFDALRRGREEGGDYNGQEQALLHRTVSLLPRMQFEGAQGLDFSVCYPQPEFDETNVMFDLNYFKYCYLKATGIDFHELRLEADFRRMAADLTSEKADTFLYRDFQARNVMLVTAPDSIGERVVTAPNSFEARVVTAPNSFGTCDSSPKQDEVFFIDFQGGRRGPLYYDLASFLWQASARYPDELRRQLVDTYYQTALSYHQLPRREEFDSRLRLFVFFRLLQVLGAYGFRGYFERKQHFIQSIAPALQSVRELLPAFSSTYPHLTDVLSRLCAQCTTLNVPSEGKASVPSAEGKANDSAEPKGRLRVRIYSFSYKRGIPADDSGNGGGYVFDCRSTHNPGRYEKYKHMTGLDQPVIQFLEDDGEILTFLESVYRLADAHVKRYVERGFTSLMFCFGCTGGQHRSVYSAEHLAEHIHQHFPEVEVYLCHREQGIEKKL